MIPARATTLSGWGRYPRVGSRLAAAGREGDVAAAIDDGSQLIARGNGRAYGDPAINRSLTLDMRGVDRLIAFDDASGVLECEAGVLLSDVIDALLPRGWFPSVTPGTKYITIGGMIAADVHGKNHHRDGSLADHLHWVDLAIGDGRVVRCSRDSHADLFAATCGGMGLTGVILRAALRMKRVHSAFIVQQTVRAANLDAAMEVFEGALYRTYSVAWIDCLAGGDALGRSLVFLGEHAEPGQLPTEVRTAPFDFARRGARNVPLDLPAAALNSTTMRLFNALYFRAHKVGERTIDVERFFYPLDAIGQWNRIYGRRGFMQYQCVVPLAGSRKALRQMLEILSKAGAGSFLAVLKRLGDSSLGMLSFPIEGYTLALDLPVSDRNLVLLDQLDEILLASGGRLYLAKDSRAAPATIAAGYPRLGEFRKVREHWDLTHRFVSAQSQRLGL